MYERKASDGADDEMVMGITLAFAAGIWLAGLFKPDFVILYTCATLSTIIAGWRIRAGARYGIVALMSLFCILGVVRALHAEAESTTIVSRFAGQPVTVFGRVAEMPEWTQVDYRSVRIKYIVAAESVQEFGSSPQAATGSILIDLYQPQETKRAVFGDKVVLRGTLRLPHGYNNPGQADSVSALRLQGIVARITLQPEHLQIIPGGPAHWEVFLATIRETITRNIEQSMAPQDAALLKGILFGGYFGISREVVRDFSASGLVHILSVSGTHIALVAGFVMWLGGRLRMRSELSAALAGVFVVFYAVFAGLTPPVIRSVIMGLAALGALILGRSKDASTSLAVAVLVMLVYQPSLLYNISFQLSVGATAGLVYLYPKTRSLLSRLPAWVAEPLAVTMAAQLAALPMMAWYFSSISIGALLANIVALPVIEAVVLIGLLGSLCGFCFAAIGKLLLVCSGLLIGLAEFQAKWIAALPGSVLYVPPMGLWMSGCYYLLVAWCYEYLPARILSPLELWRRRPLLTAGIIALTSACLFFIIYTPRPLEVHFIDVGQGDATLVITPNRKAVLIDTGGTGGLAGFDVGERVVVPYLRHQGVTSLTYLILTHAHQDHAGGAAGIAATVPIHSSIVSEEASSPAIQSLKRTTAGKGVIPAGNMTINLEGVSFEISRVHDDSETDQGNALTCVVRVSFGNQSFLITGDMGAAGERALIGASLKPGTVLKIGHHGARTSTTQEFLQVYRPQYAVISAGFDNRFGHPHEETLARLSGFGVRVYRTDLDGAIIFRTNGTSLNVEPTLSTR